MRRAAKVDAQAGKPSKYGAVRTTVDGHTFASKREARRYGELLILAKRGEIRNLMLQPKFPLYAFAPISDTGSVLVGHYIADFSYQRLDKRESYGSAEWRDVVEDVKGVATETFRLKKKMVEAIYGIKVEIVK
jgi:hypothetical protein